MVHCCSKQTSMGFDAKTCASCQNISTFACVLVCTAHIQSYKSVKLCQSIVFCNGRVAFRTIPMLHIRKTSLHLGARVRVLAQGSLKCTSSGREKQHHIFIEQHSLAHSLWRCTVFECNYFYISLLIGNRRNTGTPISNTSHRFQSSFEDLLGSYRPI